AGGVSEGCDASIRENRRYGDDVIERDAVLETMRTTGVLGDVSTDGAGSLTRRIRRVMQPMRRYFTCQHRVHYARLDHRELIDDVDPEDAAKSVESQQHHAVGECAAGETGPGAPRYEGHVLARELTDYRNDFVARAGKDGDTGNLRISRKAVGAVRQQLALSSEHPARPDDGSQFFGERRVH